MKKPSVPPEAMLTPAEIRAIFGPPADSGRALARLTSKAYAVGLRDGAAKVQEQVRVLREVGRLAYGVLSGQLGGQESKQRIIRRLRAALDATEPDAGKEP